MKKSRLKGLLQKRKTLSEMNFSPIALLKRVLSWQKAEHVHTLLDRPPHWDCMSHGLSIFIFFLDPKINVEFRLLIDEV